MTVAKRMNTLLKREVKSFFKNWNVLFLCLLPVLFCFIYTSLFHEVNTNIDASKYEILSLCLGINLILIAGFMIAILIAEEKEQNTLRTIIHFGVSPLEILLAKVVITLLVTEFQSILLFCIVGMEFIYLAKFILFTTLVAISIIEIGAIIGLIVPNQMSAGTVGTPIFMVILMLPIFSSFNKNVEYIAMTLPNYNMNLILLKLFNGGKMAISNMKNIAIILLWILIAGILLIHTYKKTGLNT